LKPLPFSRAGIMIFNTERVSPERVDLSRQAWKITTEDDISRLAQSIASVGLTAPPVLMASGDRYQIICGFRRIRACIELGWTEIEARIAGADTTESDAVKLAVADNAFQRPLNLIEQSRAFNLLAAFFPRPKDLIREASALGLPGGASQKLLPLCRMPQEIQDGVLAETIPLATALELASMEPDDAAAFARLFTVFRFSLNKQREILVLIREIAIREDISIADVFAAIEPMASNEDIDRNQRAQVIREYLQQRRFPAITAAQARFEALLRELKPGDGVRLIPPRHFEGTVWNFSLDFENMDDLESRKNALKRIFLHPGFRDFFVQNR